MRSYLNLPYCYCAHEVYITCMWRARACVCLCCMQKVSFSVSISFYLSTLCFFNDVSNVTSLLFSFSIPLFSHTRVWQMIWHTLLATLPVWFTFRSFIHSLSSVFSLFVGWWLLVPALVLYPLFLVWIKESELCPAEKIPTGILFCSILLFFLLVPSTLPFCSCYIFNVCASAIEIC